MASCDMASTICQTLATGAQPQTHDVLRGTVASAGSDSAHGGEYPRCGLSFDPPHATPADVASHCHHGLMIADREVA